jgi:hypothetical protein
MTNQEAGAALPVVERLRAYAVPWKAHGWTDEAKAINEAADTIEELYSALVKAAPFVGWASTRDQIVAGVRATELCDLIDALLAKLEAD